MLLSFGSSQWLVFPPPGWTLKWYGQFFSNADWMNAAMASLKVAVLTTVFAVALGLPTAFALVRGRFPGRELLYGLFTLPMIVPLVIIAVAVYAVGDVVNWRYALLMMLAATAGGYIGARVARRIPAAWLRWGIVVTGLVMTGIFFWRQ